MISDGKNSRPHSEGIHGALTLNNIDFLRFICAAIVFLSHSPNFLNISSIHDFEVLKRHSFIESLDELVFCGPAAVMMFFVISGVCIHAPNRNRIDLNVLDFYTRRFVRIGIPLLVAYPIKVALFGSGGFPPLPVWSLWCEMFYYLLYPFLMLLIFRFGFLAVLLTSLLCSLLLASTPDSHGGLAWTYGPYLTWILFLPVWLLGVAVVDQIDRANQLGTLLRRPTAIILASLLIFSLSVMCNIARFHCPFVIPFKWSTLFFGVASAGFVFLMLTKDFSNSSFMRFLDRQGQWSYSFYLMHQIGMRITIDVLVLLRISHFSQIISLGITGLLVIIVILVSLLFYHLCERPAHLLAKHLASRVGHMKKYSIGIEKIKFLYP